MGAFRATVALITLVAGVSPALAHHIAGKVYCDRDLDGVIDRPGDTTLSGIGVRIMSLDVSPGQVFSGTTDGGGYNVGLPARTDRYSVELTGLPVGFTVVLPAGGTYTIQIITNSAQDHRDDVDFLVQGCGPTTTSTTTSTTNTTSTTRTTTTTSTTRTTTSTTTTSTTTSTLPILCVCPAVPYLVAREAKINNDAAVSANLGANDPGGRVRLGRSVVMADGTTVTGDTVILGNATSVFDVRAGTLLRGPDVTIRGTTGAAALPIVQPFCTLPPIVCGGPDVLVRVGESEGPLAPGTYGQLRVLNGGTLTLAPGVFTFCDVKLGRNATLRPLGAATLDVEGDVVIAPAATLGPPESAPPMLVNAGGKLVRISQGAFANAAFVAPFARITFGRDARLLGCFCTDRAKSDKHITLDCPGP